MGEGAESPVEMSSADDDGGFIRTVTPLSRTRPDQEMDVIGWLLFLGMLIVLLPLLPVILAVWLFSRLLGR